MYNTHIIEYNGKKYAPHSLLAYLILIFQCLIVTLVILAFYIPVTLFTMAGLIGPFVYIYLFFTNKLNDNWNCNIWVCSIVY